MGKSGLIVLVNATDTDWHLVHYHYYQMNRWFFPPEVPSGDFAEVLVEWDEGLFTVTKDDAGEALYELEDTGGKQLEVQARGDPFRLQVLCNNFKPVGPSIAMQEFTNYDGDHEMTFVLSEPQPGKYYTEHY